MNDISPIKASISVGITSVVIYLACFLILKFIGKAKLVKLANLLFHGMDFSNIIRNEIPLVETLFGVLTTFIFWAFIGFLFTMIYKKLVA